MPRAKQGEPEAPPTNTEAPADVPSSPEPTQEPALAQPPEEAPAVATSDERYTLGSWGGLVQYNCARCPWDTVTSLEAFNAHWEQHAPPPPPPPVSVLVAPDGRPLTLEV